MLIPGTDSQSFLLNPAHSLKCQQKKSYIGTKREAEKNSNPDILFFIGSETHSIEYSHADKDDESGMTIDDATQTKTDDRPLPVIRLNFLLTIGYK